MAKWHKTKYPGIRYREHSARKHGIQKDKYFAIRYQKDGIRTEEGMGWASRGWTLQKVNAKLAELKENQRTGQGPQTLKEKRDLLKDKCEQELAEQERQSRENILFTDYFAEVYFKTALISKKPETCRTELQYFKNWIEPAFKSKPFKEIAPLHCEKLKKKLLSSGRTPRTLQYIFAIIRQVWNMAKRDGLISSESPTKHVSVPKIDNKRLRFLSHDEADILLNELSNRSLQLHDISLLALHCGLRAGEIYGLSWNDIDLDRGLISVKDTKSGHNRPAFMTKPVKVMLADKKQSASSGIVFSDRHGRKIKQLSNAFSRAVTKLGFNDGIIDHRQKVVFHTLRHTFASWLVQGGTDLYTVQKLMGHSSFEMVQRYAHLSEGTLQTAVKNLEESMNKRNNVLELQQKRK